MCSLKTAVSEVDSDPDVVQEIQDYYEHHFIGLQIGFVGDGLLGLFTAINLVVLYCKNMMDSCKYQILLNFLMVVIFISEIIYISHILYAPVESFTGEDLFGVLQTLLLIGAISW